MMPLKNTKKIRITGTNFRWVVPQLPAEIWSKKQQYKTDLLDRLRLSKTAKKGIKYYSIAIESHADGNPHLDMLIILQKRTDLYLDQLDFLCQKHGDLTRYRTLNAAILDYSSKEDTPLTNCLDAKQLLAEQALKKDPYVFLQEHMLRDPYTFNIAQFCERNDYFRYLSGFNAIESRLKKHQQARCNSLLKSKPGIRIIDKELIQSTLTTSEQELYHSHSFYGTIIRYLNQINLHGWTRPFTSNQLYISGKSRIGKSYLIQKKS